MRAVLFVARKEMNQSPAAIIDTDKRSIAEDRPRDWMTLDCEVCLDVADELEWIFAGAIAFVDECENRNSSFFTNFEELACPFLDTAAVVEEHDCAVGG